MELHGRPELAARHRMVDDATGDVKVRGREINCLFQKYRKHKGKSDCYMPVLCEENGGTLLFVLGVAH